jgi:hypothetical protein
MGYNDKNTGMSYRVSVLQALLWHGFMLSLWISEEKMAAWG